MAPIAVGDKLPDLTLQYLDEDNQSRKFNMHEELKGKKVVLLAVPGAFTPTCRYRGQASHFALYAAYGHFELYAVYGLNNYGFLVGV